MEKIERLAHLDPLTSTGLIRSQVSKHSAEMFHLLRAYAMLDWVMRHPNDLGEKASELKFEKLVERTWELMSVIQSDLEGERPSPTTSILTL
jgi:hypothetical protein